MIQAIHAAGWYPADPITLRSSIAIIGSVIFHRPYENAPVSNLYYDHRREDLAFEKPAGKSANARNHVRFWLVLEQGAEGRPVWLGAATFDRGVGLSHLTGQVTHHIAPNIDAARGLLATDLETAGMVEATYQVSGIGPTFNGRNGERAILLHRWRNLDVAPRGGGREEHGPADSAAPAAPCPPQGRRLEQTPAGYCGKGAWRDETVCATALVERKTLPKADTCTE